MQAKRTKARKILKKPIVKTVPIAKSSDYSTQNIFVVNKDVKIIALFIAAILIFIFVILRGVAALNDKSKLDWATHRLVYVQSQLNNVVAGSGNTQLSKSCEHENAGFGRTGQLICGVSIEGYYDITSAAEAQATEQRIVTFLQSDAVFNDHSYTGPLDSFSTTAHGMHCGWTTNTITDEVVAHDVANNHKSQVEFSIGCGTPAHWQFYPIDGS